jgi:hypothetical protein
VESWSEINKSKAIFFLAVVKNFATLISNFAEYQSSDYAATFVLVCLSHSAHWMKIMLIALLSVLWGSTFST